MQSLPKLISILVFLFVSIQVHAQMRDKTIFHYNDGSVFIGTVLEENSQKAKVQLTTSDTISIQKTLVKKTYRDLLYFSDGKFHIAKGGFFHFSQSGGANRDDGTYQIKTIFGYRHNERLEYGMGLAYSTNNTRIVGIRTIPRFLTPMLYARYYPWSKKVRPFASLSLGYSFPLESRNINDLSGGVYLKPAVGLKFASKKLSRLTLSVGQMLQKTKGNIIDTDRFGNPVNADFKILLNRTMFTVGVDIH